MAESRLGKTYSELAIRAQKERSCQRLKTE
jgi:hypothetical protein